MNILLVAMGLDIGGAETHVVSLAENLKKQGHHPVVVSSGGVYEKELLALNIAHYNSGLKEKGLKTTLDSISNMKKIIKNEKIDIIHAHGRIPAFISKIVSIITNTPFMTTGHAMFDYGGLYKYLTFWGEDVIAISEDVKKHLIDKFNIKEEKITLITNGIDTEKFNSNVDTSYISEELKIKDETIKVVYMSRISGQLAEVARISIDAIKQLRSSGCDIEILIVGDGDDYIEIKNYSNKLNSEKNYEYIHLLGKRTDIAQIMSYSNFAIVVSRTALEAMACEKPVIIAGGEGYMGLLTKDNIKEAVNNNFTGRTTKDKITVDNLVSEIEKLMGKENENKTAKLGDLGRSVVEEYFSIDSMTKETIKIYQRLLDRRK